MDETTDFAYTRVTAAAQNTKTVYSLSRTIPRGGFMYIYLSNESTDNMEVYFDELEITHTKGKILQEDHYYPFGMNISALSSTAPLSKPNSFKANSSTEFNTDLNIDWYETLYRSFDPQIGKFLQIDALTEILNSDSLYNFSFNNPISFSDFTGLMGDNCPTGNCDNYIYGEGERSGIYDYTIEADRPDPMAIGRSMSAYHSFLYDLSLQNNVISRGLYSAYTEGGAGALRGIFGQSRTLSSTTDGYRAAIQHGRDYIRPIGQLVAYGIGGTMVAAVAAPALVKALPSVGAISATIDLSSQVIGNTLANGGNISAALGNVNLTSVGISALNPTASLRNVLLNSTISSSFDISSNGGINTIFNGQSAANVGTNVAFSLGAYGVFRGGGVLGQSGMTNSRRMMQSLQNAGFTAGSKVMNREAYILGVSFILNKTGASAGAASVISNNLLGN